MHTKSYESVSDANSFQLEKLLNGESPELDALFDEYREFDPNGEHELEEVQEQIALAKNCLCIERAEREFEAWNQSTSERYIREGENRIRRSASDIRRDAVIADIWRVRSNELQSVRTKGMRLKEPGKLYEVEPSFKRRVEIATQFVDSLKPSPSEWCIDGSTARGDFKPDSDIDITLLYPESTDATTVEASFFERLDPDTGLVDGKIDVHPFFESSLVFRQHPKLLETIREQVSQNKSIVQERLGH